MIEVGVRCYLYLVGEPGIFFLFFIEVYLIYNVVLVSGAQQSYFIYIYSFSYSFPLKLITKY